MYYLTETLLPVLFIGLVAYFVGSIALFIGSILIYTLIKTIHQTNKNK